VPFSRVLQFLARLALVKHVQEVVGVLSASASATHLMFPYGEERTLPLTKRAVW
jgi:hypothetical protein